MVRQLALVGCGLIGGSFALALRRAGLVGRVVGYNRSAQACADALRLNVIDEAALSAAEAVAGADLVLVAVPVGATEAVLASLREALDPAALLMDVGSTKRDVVDAAQRALHGRFASFVPAHPIAGKESAGVNHAEAGLFDGRRVILTPTPSNTPELVRRAAAIWTGVGGVVEQMTPERHDAAFAAVSHLPHLLAFAYVNAMLGQPDGAAHLRLAGPGFRDFTRIAAAEPAVWRDILASNRDEVLRQSTRFREALDAIEQVLRQEDGAAVEALIRTASGARSGWQLDATRPPAVTR